MDTENLVIMHFLFRSGSFTR